MSSKLWREEMSSKLGRRYSGLLSRKFWARVNRLPADEQQATYVMGCMLQDLEERVLRYLTGAETRVAAGRKERKK